MTAPNDKDIRELRSAAELKAFANALVRKGGFAEAVGGLLIVHATMYGP